MKLNAIDYSAWFRTLVTDFYKIRNCSVAEQDYGNHGYFVTLMFDRRGVFARKHPGGLKADDTSHEFDAFHSLYMRMAKVCSPHRVDRSPLLPLAIVGADQEGSRFGEVSWSGQNLHIHALVFGHPDCQAQMAELAKSASMLPGQEGLELVTKVQFRRFDPSVGVTDYVAKSLAKSFHSPSSVNLLRIYPSPSLIPKRFYSRCHALPVGFERMRLVAQRELVQPF